MKLRTIPAWNIGLVQAAIVLGYILSFAFSIQGIHNWLGDDLFPNPFVGMAFFLTAFVFSALVCGSAMLAYPIILLLEKNVRRAMVILCWSAAWLAVFLGTVLFVAVERSL